MLTKEEATERLEKYLGLYIFIIFTGFYELKSKLSVPSMPEFAIYSDFYDDWIKLLPIGIACIGFYIHYIAIRHETDFKMLTRILLLLCILTPTPATRYYLQGQLDTFQPNNVQLLTAEVIQSEHTLSTCGLLVKTKNDLELCYPGKARWWRLKPGRNVKIKAAIINNQIVAYDDTYLDLSK